MVDAIDRAPLEVFQDGSSLEKMRVGGLGLVAVPLEHKDGLDQHIWHAGMRRTLREVVPELVKGSDGVIFEYFPEELRRQRLAGGLLNIESNSRVTYFDGFQMACQNDGRTAYVLDPAYDEAFGLLSPVTALPVVSSPTFLALGEFIKSGHSADSSMISRRRLLGLASLGGLGYMAGGLVGLSAWVAESTNDQPNPVLFNEAHFRRVIVAKGIMNMSRRLEMNEKSLLLAYPPVHWEGIKALLLDQRKLNEDFAFYRKLPIMPNHFFVERAYKPMLNEWIKQETSIE